MHIFSYIDLAALSNRLSFYLAGVEVFLRAPLRYLAYCLHYSVLRANYTKIGKKQ